MKIQYLNKNKYDLKNISLVLVICIMGLVLISKSYAIYKLQEDYDVIKQKIDGYTPGDIQIAAIIDGEETDEFPSYETNYKVLSVECTNGATGLFDVENWRIAIDDMSSTSTKCTVSFDSTRKNTVTPVNMTKTEILALNEEIRNTSARAIADYLYPVGSIFISTELATINQVEEKFGGTWVRYSTDTTLVGYKDDSTKEVNSTGGSSNMTIKTSDIPSLSLSGTTDSTGSGYTISHTYSSRGVTSWSGSHSHVQNRQNWVNTPAQYNNFNSPSGSGYYFNTADMNVNNLSTYATTITVSGQTTTDYYANKITGVEAHTHTYTTEYTNEDQTSIDIQNPYTVVYMYKRTA